MLRTSNPLTILLTHNLWATRSVIEACRPLTHEQFHQSFDMGLGSLHDTVRHIIGAMRGWTDVLAQRDFGPRLEDGDALSVDELLTLLDETHEEMQSLANAHDVAEEVTASRGGRSFTFTRGGILTHVTTHGMHHRAQCINMLRQLGIEVDKLPNPSVLNWMLTADAAE